jgi:hypothetical protein
MGAPRFAVRDLFLCVALIAVGLGLLVPSPFPSGYDPVWGAKKIAGLMAIGAGVGAPLKRVRLGAYVGLAIAAVILVVAVIAEQILNP